MDHGQPQPWHTDLVAEALAVPEQRFRQIFMHTTLPQALTDPSGRFVAANSGYCDLVGYSDEALFETDFHAVTHPEDRREQEEALRQLLSGRKHSVRLSKRYTRADGATLRCQLHLAAVRDDNGATRYLHGAVEDVQPDAVTGVLEAEPLLVPTAAVARHEIGRILSTTTSGSVQVALLRLEGLERLAGVIGLSSIEDTHADIVQRVVASGSMGIRAVMPLGVTDILVLADTTDGAALPAVLQAALRSPLSLNGVLLPVKIRIGVTTGGPLDDPDSLLRQALMALGSALNGGGPESRYDPSLDAGALDDFALTTEIALGLADEQFELVYQPKYRLSPYQPVGFEALLRWKHPERGDVHPERVVRLAESSGLIAPLTCWVIDAAAAQAAAWRDAGTPAPIAVNISPEMLTNPTLPLHLSQAVTRHGLRSSSLELEITETALSTTPNAVRAVEQLTELGYAVSVDDFGTGYSSLAAIKRLPLTAIKIDRMFVKDATRVPREGTLLSAIIEIAHRLGCRVIAEGVEDEETLVLLRDLGCDEAQGFHLGRPARPGDLAEHLPR